MAQRVVVTLTDDLDGSEAAETVHFGLDGKSYEIDLTEKNAKKLRKLLAPYVESGRRQARNGKAFRRAVVTPDATVVRAWAASNGIELSNRGRIPGHVYDAYAKAN
ncbi:Lsr2 family protein [Kitasatospora sp. NPDC059646]|uniref:histone-like nucleoid-structuring protein Lsr2 n=1 Tax=Kitasatospora sp. NPDC059646 TaxID=3346893 RepID=UPI00367511E1